MRRSPGIAGRSGTRVAPRARIGAGAAALVLVLVTAAASGREAPIPRQVSVKDSPGYYPPSDPESLAAVIGRRLNAPAVREPFHGGARSLDDLGRAICGAIHRADRDSLLRLCVSEEEFRDILWREFPQSRPAVGLTWEDGWRVLGARLRSGCSQAVTDYGGHWYQFVRFERVAGGDTLSAYRNFKLHQRLVMVVRDDAGQVQHWTWLRAAAERKRAFKIYSTDD